MSLGPVQAVSGIFSQELWLCTPHLAVQRDELPDVWCPGAEPMSPQLSHARCNQMAAARQKGSLCGGCTGAASWSPPIGESERGTQRSEPRSKASLERRAGQVMTAYQKPRGSPRPASAFRPRGPGFTRVGGDSKEGPVPESQARSRLGKTLVTENGRSVGTKG